MSANESPFSPRSLIALFGATIEMMLGRRSIDETHAHDSTGAWQAILASMITGSLLLLLPPLRGGVPQFVGHISAEFISLALAVIIFSAMLHSGGHQERLFAFVVPFVWVHNVFKLFTCAVQILQFVTQQLQIFLLLLPILCWCVYWMWRVGRDQVGRGGRYAAMLIFVFMTVEAVVGLLLLARLDLGAP